MSNTHSIKSAAVINIIGKYSSIIINLIYLGILSRILTPQEFGIVAVVTVFTTFFTLFANMGIGPAVIQNKNLTNIDLKSIFALTFYIGIAISMIFSLLSYPISLFYSNDVYIGIGLLLSVALFFNTINIVPNAILLKEHMFKTVAFRTVAVGIISAIPTVILAILGWSYYSIVIHSILVAFLTFLWNIATAKSPISFVVTKESIVKIKEFSRYQYAFSLINYFSRNLDNLLIGRFIGEYELGLYNKSYQLMQYPVQNLTQAITPVLHPILSMYQNQKEVIYNKYLKILKILSISGVFITVYAYIASYEILLIIFGEQWIESTRSLQLLSISIWFQMLTSSTGTIFQSLNRTKLLMITGAINSFNIVVFIIIGLLIGSIESVAIMVSLAYILVFFEAFYILIKFGFNTSLISFAKELIFDLLNMSVLFIIMIWVSSLIEVQSLILSGLYKLIATGIIYLIILIITGRYKSVLKVLNFKKISKRRRG
jgi:teichuronic acid exporter